MKPYDNPLSRYLRANGIDGVELAAILCISEGTARQRLHEPEKLTLGQMELISKASGLPLKHLLYKYAQK